MKLKLKNKIALSTSITLISVLAITIVLTSIRTRDFAIDSSTKTALESAKYSAYLIKNGIDLYMSQAQSFASIIKATKGNDNPISMSRQELSSQTKSLLKDLPKAFGVFVIFEPNAFDGKDAQFAGTFGHDIFGRLNIYWTRDEKNILSLEAEPDTALNNMDVGSYYYASKVSNACSFLEPSVYPLGDMNVLLASITAPISVNNKFIGAVGIDFGIDFLQEEITSVAKLHPEMSYNLLNNTGILMASTENSKLISQKIEKHNPRLKALFDIACKTENYYSTVENDTFSIFMPFKVASTNTNSYVNINIPMEKITSEASSLLWILIFSSFILITIGIVAIVLVVSHIIKPISTLEAFALEIADGKINQEIDIKTGDEIEKLASAFNSVVVSVKSLVNENREISKEAISGNFKYRAEASKFRGDYKMMIEETNAIVEAFAVPLTILGDYVIKIDNGEIPEKLIDNREGNFIQIRNAVNHLIDTLISLDNDAQYLANGAKDGQVVQTRADASKHKGIFSVFYSALTKLSMPFVYLLEKLCRC